MLKVQYIHQNSYLSRTSEKIIYCQFCLIAPSVLTCISSFFLLRRFTNSVITVNVFWFFCWRHRKMKNARKYISRRYTESNKEIHTWTKSIPNTVTSTMLQEKCEVGPCSTLTLWFSWEYLVQHEQESWQLYLFETKQKELANKASNYQLFEMELNI